MRSRVESQIIPDIAVDAANPKNSVRVSDEGLASGGDHYIAKILASTYVIALSRPSANGLKLRLNSGVTVQRDFQHSADSISANSASRGMLARHASTPFRSIERRNDFHWGW